MNNKNSLAVFLKIIATLTMIVGAITGLSVISTANDNPVAFLSTYAGIWIIVGSVIVSLFFFALGEMISILHDIRKTNEEIKYHVSH